jgi:hypothetical protein
MTFRRTLFLVRVPFVIHVVQKSDGLPQIGIGTTAFGEVLHGIRNGMAMSPQTFRLDPFVQNPERSFGQHRHLAN